tara:strand:- start:28320 stop:28733 length:414 start_codon:yes stop_codon:yes gene_type:complete
MSKQNEPQIKMSDVIGISYWYKGASLREASPVANAALSKLTDSDALSKHLDKINANGTNATPYTSIRVAFVADETLLCDSEQYEAFVNFANLRGWNASDTLTISGKEQQCYVNPSTNVRSHTVFFSPKGAKIERDEM